MTTTMAYDFGDTIHVLDLDEHGAHQGEPAILPTTDAGRDAVLQDWGYRIIGTWTIQGEAEGVEVERHGVTEWTVGDALYERMRDDPRVDSGRLASRIARRLRWQGVWREDVDGQLTPELMDRVEAAARQRVADSYPPLA